MGVTVTKDLTASVLANIHKLVEQDVLVGIPESNDERRDDQGITNAALGYLHTHGGTILIPAHAQTIYRKVDINGDFARGGRFVKAADSNFATTHHVDAYTVTLPPRPFLKPGIIRRDKINAQMRAAAMAAVNGKPAQIQEAMVKAGIVAVDGVKSIFTDGSLTPLAPSTIRQKGGKDNPLLLTGQLRDANTYVIREK